MNQMNTMSQMPRAQMNSCRRVNPVCEQQNSHDAMSQMQLLNHVNEVSFAVDDILLYLDTHPQDQNALAYAREKIQMRKSALESYARRFGPLTIDCAAELNSNCWLWISQPWPWETKQKGGC